MTVEEMRLILKSFLGSCGDYYRMLVLWCAQLIMAGCFSKSSEGEIMGGSEQESMETESIGGMYIILIKS